MTDSYFLIPTVIAHIFNTELIIPTKTPVNKVNTEIETQSLTAEMKKRKCSK